MVYAAVIDTAVVFVAGLLFGSFANVCIHRIPRRLSVVAPASHCPYCQQKLRPWHNLPVLSYLCLGGRCATCKISISPRYPLIELANALLYVWLYIHFSFSPEWFVFAGLTTALLIVSCIDLSYTIIPDIITFPGIVIGAGVSTFYTSVGLSNAFLGILLGGGLFLGVAVLSVILLGREGMGGGDIKLIAMIGAFLGWQAVLLTIFLGAAFGAAIGLVLMVIGQKTRRDPVPFGPFLALAAVVTMVWGEELLRWYGQNAP
ncbi:MAG: A24 family peptidase [Candidatus Tectimicrobiota bacterium]